ncbi:MAG TPA: DEAD/DEAH box helicase [Vicinamibacterales bacterium]|nr:DEAD/DEAH box helicase [Vicinamibacterales bacterium]HPW19923.1 DEAD/DEAH box helicase [Vicinamibacterales bacterium]
MLPGGDARRDQALEMALREVLPDQAVRERPDQPDGLVTAVRRVPARDADFEDLPPLVDPRLRDALARRGIDRLYSHQARAVAHALAGRHVVVTTPTASGKTLCYNIPVMNAVLADPSSRALYLFPTKALAQDQLAELDRLTREIARASDVEVGAFTYDGDTPQDARRAIRGRANVVLTNPDMLHAGVLPHHPKWAKLFGGLRYVVIDELHAYRGVFGSHLANVLRRLRRVCEHYGSSPTFICSSATIANPVELAESLAERPFELVAESGAPRGEKWLVFVNPPIVNRQLGIRRSYISQSRGLALEFLQKGLQVIVFAQSRLSTEILTRYLKDAHDGAPGESDLIRGYRGGYLPHRRREIERGLREGAVRGVVSTNALELGIDIGALDVAVLAGYPGTIASTWQRFGRAGRRSGRSAGVLVASSAPLDQYVVRHPAYFFDASPEHALVNPDNLQILVDHVKCAAFELPFATTDTFGRENVQDILGILAEEGFVHLSRPGSAEGAAGRWHWTSESYPADAISLRTVSSDNFVVVDVTGKPRDIGETDFNTALEILHEKAIYIVEGRLYQVERLDVEGRKAYVRHVDCDYYTDAITYSRVTPLDTAGAAGERPRALAAHGDVHVVSRVVGFKKIKFYTNENVGSGELDLPERQMHTTSYWLTVPRELVGSLSWPGDDRRDGVVGMAYAMRQVAQLLLMCDARDIGVSIGSARDAAEDGSAQPAAGPPSGVTPGARDGDEPRVFIYDNYPGGIGFSAPLFRMHRDLLARTRELIAGCPCESGCPSCVGPLGDVGPKAKEVALELLGRLQ